MGCESNSQIASLLKESNVKVIPLVFKSKFDLKNASMIRDITKKYKIDLINAQSSKDRYSTILAKKIYGADSKLVFTRRQVSKSVGGPQSWLYNWGADAFVAVSESIKETLIKDGINPKKIAVIQNGTPHSKYDSLDPSKTEIIKQDLKIKDDEFVIGCVSRLKNQVQILRAAEHLDFPVRIIFIGIEKLPYYDIDKLKQKGHKINFVGKIPSNEILDYYKLFDVKILASTMEGLSQSLLEAMYLKVPVIATAAAGNLNLISNNQNGLLFEDNDIEQLAENIIRIKEDNDLRFKLIANGYKTASIDFSIENTIDGYEQLFYDLIHKKTVQ